MPEPRPPPPNRHDDCVDVRQVFEDSSPIVPIAGHHKVIVERVHERALLIAGE